VKGTTQKNREATAIAIEVRDFSKRYGEVVAVSGVSFSVARGELFGLIGPDGAGKTTTMRTLCTLLACEQGDMRVDGLDVRTEISRIRAILGYMPQRFSLYPDLSVRQNLNFFADLFGVSKKEKRERLERLYHFSQLKAFESRLAGALSGGMKQKLALSCTLIHTPDILILDEPTTGVDPVSRREFWAILRQLKEDGVTILVSTPYMDEADLCDRVAFMYEGEILALDRPARLADYFEGALYEVLSGDNRRMESYFTTEVAARSVQIFGDRLHVSFPQKLGADTRDRIIEQAPAKIESFQQIVPTTEDTFLALMQNREASA